MIDHFGAWEDPRQRVIVADVNHMGFHTIFAQLPIRKMPAVEIVHHANGFFPVRQQFPHERGTNKTGSAGDDAFGLHS